MRFEGDKMGVYRYTICDVFTDQPLAGNQLAVFPYARAIPDTTLQSPAREINFSETVFTYPPSRVVTHESASSRRDTSCHLPDIPSLARPSSSGTATNTPEVRLETGRGVVSVRLERDEHRVTFGWMSQPLPTGEPLGDPTALLGALGVKRSTLPVEIYDNGVRHLYVALETEEAVALLRPDLGLLAQLVELCGVNCFWSSGRRVEIQRPSTLYARVYGRDGHPERIEVGGAAVIVGSGEFRL